ncbi:MAG: hypothetical protein ACRD6X_20740, partial [Pyrinomonadaceae bacterium]
MMHDTVREELKTKVGKITSSELPAVTIVEEIEPVSVKIDPPPMAPREKSLTSELVKKNTSPTLVDFQHKNPTLPEWRIELQNAIRKRNANGAYSNMEAAAKPVPVALQPEPQVAVTSSSILKNKKVANALDRIERSRKTFAAVGTAAAPAKAPAQRTPVLTNRSFPFNVVERTTTAPKPSVQKPLTVEIPKPKLV